MFDIKPIVEHLTSSQVIAYPTETLWGLGVDALNQQAIEKLFALKGRDTAKAVSILVRDIEMAKEYAVISPAAEQFLQLVWPGPVTVVFERRSRRLGKLCGHGSSIGLRCSSHPLVHKLVWSYKNPITTTSANPSGQASAQNRDDLTWLPKDVLICPYEEQATEFISKGSTVVRWSNQVLQILRQGDIAAELIHRAALASGLPLPSPA